MIRDPFVLTFPVRIVQAAEEPGRQPNKHRTRGAARSSERHVMKLLASLRSLLAPVDQPLALIGPGGDFVDALVERNGRTDFEVVIDEIVQEKITIDWEASGLEQPARR